MSGPWLEDFSYTYYRRLLHAIRANFRPQLFSDTRILPWKQQERPTVLLRHDVDLDLSLALTMAGIEIEFGVHSCYMVMTRCPFYSIRDESSKAILLRLV